MADSWSNSGTVTLTNQGDWAKWSITLSSTDATNLNNLGNDFLNFIGLRIAMSAASRDAFLAVIVNDYLGLGSSAFFPGLGGIAHSSADWISANRFAAGPGDTVGGFSSVGFPVDIEAGRGITGATPWVAGSNTIRVLSLGRQPDGAAEPVEIDFLGVQAGDPPYLFSTGWGFGFDDVLDTKPVTVPFGHTGYDDHVNPDPLDTNSPHPPTWILEGGTAATGTATDTVLEVIKFCPPTAKIRVTESGSPVTGLVGAFNDFDLTFTTTTLDGAGEATFTVGLTGDTHFWYGGTDDWAPAALELDGDVRVGCTGWNLHRIGMSA